MPWETGRQISKIKQYIVFTGNNTGSDGNVKEKKMKILSFKKAVIRFLFIALALKESQSLVPISV